MIHTSNGPTWVVVPVREASRRLPGKALAAVGEWPLFVHVAVRAARAAVDRVVVATDSDAVLAACADHGLEAVRTGPAPSGTHRVWAALQSLGEPSPAWVVNVQGDQPALDPDHVDAALEAAWAHGVGTVAAPLADPTPTRRVKVVTDALGRALYFSRAPIPHGGPHWMHLGIYAFARDRLAACVAAPRCEGTAGEELEQLAWLHAGIAVGVAMVPEAEAPVDEEPDLVRIRALLATEGDRTAG